jgi:uncharacterized protein YkwD
MKTKIAELRGVELGRLKLELKLSRGELLTAEQVVKAARDSRKYPTLHSSFEWDDTKAAQEYRLIQARVLIVSVRIIPPKSTQPVQAFVSLKQDRKRSKGGYREIISVLSQKELRSQLLQQAWDEFNYWRGKYQQLKELAPLFEVADKIARTGSKRRAG